MHSEKTILLVDDDRVDAMAVKRALRELRISNPVEHRLNGEEALDFLRSEAARDRGLAVVLLDLNMPRMNGLEMLAVARDENLLRGTPVFVLTTSKEEQDLARSYDLGITGYSIKPSSYPQFREALRSISVFWRLQTM